MTELIFDLPVGLHTDGSVLKKVELLPTNGVAEKVFVKKLSEKPYTWQGNVVSIAVKSIGDIEIAHSVRKKYLETGSVTIPPAVKKLTLADVNTLLIEIHRRVWISFLPKQEIVCKFCGRRLIADINLDKIDFLPETKEKMLEENEYNEIVVDISDAFVPPEIPRLTDDAKYLGITEIPFNRFVFRPPLLSDGIRNEKYFADSIDFWRRIAFDCLVSIQKVTDNIVEDELPTEFHKYYGIKLFNEFLSGRVLREIRAALTESLPTLPFAYFEPCGCDEQREIPMVMDVSNFFSE